MSKHTRLMALSLLSFLRVGSLVLALGILFLAPAQAQILKPVGEGIYAFVGENFTANAGVVITDDGVVVIESGSTPAVSKAILKEIQTLTQKPLRFIINSQSHPDHWVGNYVFSPPALVIGHEKMKGEILAMPPNRLAGIRATYQDFRTALPHITYRDKMALELGGRQFELYYLENSHTQGDTAIWLPRERILFSGSTVYTTRAPNVRDGSTTGMLKALDFLATLNPKVVIPGHGPLGEAKDIQQMKTYISLLRQRVGEEIKKGKKLDEIKTSVKVPEFSHWDRLAQELPANVESAYFDLTGLPKPKHEAHEEMRRIAGIVEKNEGGGRSITVKAASGESVTLSVSQSRTAISRAGKPAKREEIKVGEKIDAEYDAAEKNTAASIKIE